MRFPQSLRLFSSASGSGDALRSAPTDAAAQVFPALAPSLRVSDSIHPLAAAALAEWRSRPTAQSPQGSGSTLLRTIGWVSAGLGAVTVGLLVGRELRQRYKFNRRTPYDFYAHAGDERDLEFGVGV